MQFFACNALQFLCNNCRLIAQKLQRVACNKLHMKPPHYVHVDSVVYSFSAAMLRYSGRYNADMAFLNRKLWPQVRTVALCHDSVSCRKFPASFPFPVAREGIEHVGQRYDELSVGNRDDIEILQRTGVDYRCVPTSPRSTTPTSPDNR